jgi:ribosome production factor 2
MRTPSHLGTLRTQVENTKNVLFLRGTRTSETVGDCLKELWAMRKPFGKMMARKNENMHPFDDEASLEFLCQKNDCSLFTVANHSKKRPNNLVIGRTFDGHVLDMAELGIESATTLAQLQVCTTS